MRTKGPREVVMRLTVDEHAAVLAALAREIEGLEQGAILASATARERHLERERLIRVRAEIATWVS
jgi:hypothetical protein